MYCSHLCSGHSSYIVDTSSTLVFRSYSCVILEVPTTSINFNYGVAARSTFTWIKVYHNIQQIHQNTSTMLAFSVTAKGRLSALLYSTCGQIQSDITLINCSKLEFFNHYIWTFKILCFTKEADRNIEISNNVISFAIFETNTLESLNIDAAQLIFINYLLLNLKKS